MVKVDKVKDKQQLSVFSSHANSFKGFTIVELLIVIVVIGILAAITIIAYNGIQAKATVASLQSDLENDNKQMLAYLTTSSTGYPTAIDCSASPAANTICLKSSGTTTYQFSVNNSSLNNPSYCITATSGTTSYFIGSSTGVPTVGSCPGHGTGGVAPLTNIVTNPKLTLNNAGWLVHSINGGAWTQSTVTGGGPNNNNYYRVSFTTAPTTSTVVIGFGRSDIGVPIPVTVGSTYGFSIWVRSSKAIAASTNMRIRWMLGTAIASPTTDSYGSYVDLAANTWTRLSATPVVPAGTDNARILANVQSTGTQLQAGDTVDVTMAMVTSGSGSPTFADGDSPNWVWNGTANASTSTGPAQ